MRSAAEEGQEGREEKLPGFSSLLYCKGETTVINYKLSEFQSGRSREMPRENENLEMEQDIEQTEEQE